MIWWSDAPAKYRYAFAAVIGLSAVVTFATGVLTVWLAKFISLLVIAAHYLLRLFGRGSVGLVQRASEGCKPVVQSECPEGGAWEPGDCTEHRRVTTSAVDDWVTTCYYPPGA